VYLVAQADRATTTLQSAAQRPASAARRRTGTGVPKLERSRAHPDAQNCRESGESAARGVGRCPCTELTHVSLLSFGVRMIANLHIDTKLCKLTEKICGQIDTLDVLTCDPTLYKDFVRSLGEREECGDVRA
jgi:hypothetical protein